MNPIIMPYVDNHELTIQAMKDCLDQTLPDVQLLMIANGGDVVPGLGVNASRVRSWHHNPPLPSLSATWNRALQWAWESGAEHCLVVNNDVRLNPQTYQLLREAQRKYDALFVSALGVTEEQFTATQQPGACIGDLTQKGGPDFSCYLITKACHDLYQFDENFTPAYCEDLDYHRRLLLDGLGDRIFGVNLPFLHYRSSTINRGDEAMATKYHQRIEAGSRAYYVRKWGGPCNHERFSIPFDPTSDQDGVTTPQRQFGSL